MSESTDLVTLVTMVLADTAPASADVMYLFGQTADNSASVLERGARVAMDKGIKLAVCGGEGHGYDGFDRWVEELMSRGVKKEHIIEIPFKGESLNTYTEAESFVNFAARESWQSAYVSAVPFHQLRAYMSVVSVIMQRRIQLEVYNLVGEALNWNEIVTHSQGVQRGQRRSLIEAELEKIKKYQLKGDLISTTEVLNYLGRRSLFR